VQVSPYSIDMVLMLSTTFLRWDYNCAVLHVPSLVHWLVLAAKLSSALTRSAATFLMMLPYLIARTYQPVLVFSSDYLLCKYL